MPAVTALLIELYEDVQRWRDDPDARNLRYILETAEKIDPADVENLKSQSESG